MDEEAFEKLCAQFDEAKIFDVSFNVKWLKLIGINVLAFGLELCASAGFCYIPPLLLKRGFSESALTVIMGIGPFISLLFVPVLGHWSDRCRSQFGRRRPFILALGVLLLFSLFLIPFSKEIASCFGLVGDTYALTIGVILLDFSSQAIMNPCKALIPDIFRSTEDQNSGFTVYSVMLSMGGGIGYLISAVNWLDTRLGTSLGGQEKAVFCVLAFCFSFLLMINLTLAKEIPLESTKQFINGTSCNKVDCDNHSHNKSVCSESLNLCFITSVPSHHKIDKNTVHHTGDCFKKSVTLMMCFSGKGLCCSVKTMFRTVHSFLLVPLKLFIAIKLNFSYYLHMPPLVTYLFMSCLFGWMGIMCHDSYYTDFVGQVIYQGKPKANNESVALNLYNQGVRMGSWGLLLHCLSAAIYSAFIQHRLVVKLGQRKAYLSGIIIFSLSLIGTVQTNSLVLVNVFAALSGTGYIALSTVPYSLITIYHNSKQICEDSMDRGIGEDMAVLDSAYYLSQIIPSLFLGYIVDLTGSSSTYMVVAALCGAAASYFSYFVKFPPKSCFHS